MAFSKDFLWCAVTAACRIEGAFSQYEKGLSIWDVDFMDRIKHGETAHEAADYYNRWKEDVAIMKEIDRAEKLPFFRFLGAYFSRRERLG